MQSSHLFVLLLFPSLGMFFTGIALLMWGASHLERAKKDKKE